MRVLNKYKVGGVPKGAVYIGRGSPYGNPYVIGKDGTRSEVIQKFRDHLFSLLDDVEIQEELLQLDGKDLVCFCKPAPCHGDVLIEAIQHIKRLQS